MATSVCQQLWVASSNVAPIIPSKLPTTAAGVPRSRCTRAFLRGTPVAWRRTAGCNIVSYTATSTHCPARPRTVQATATPSTETPTSVQVKVTNDTDRSATIVEVSFPDKVGGMLQMLRAVKALLLNIIRASVVTVGNVAVVRLHVVTLEGKKVTDSAILSAITPAIVGEMEGQEAMVDAALDAVEAVADGEARDLMLERYNERRDRAFTKNKVVTTVRVYPDAAHRNSVMTVQTRDRPGILVDIAKTLTDLGINIVNAEVETEDFMVRNIFFLSQGGKPLSHQMETLVTNALNFYLRTGVEDESY